MRSGDRQVGSATSGPCRVKPYYSDDYCTIYHGDCRAVLPALGPIACVVSDPPYGIGFDVTRKRTRNTGLSFGKCQGDPIRDPRWVPIANDDQPFDPSPFRDAKECILWGANNYASRLPDARGWLVWDKLGNKTPSDFGDCELAWTNIDTSIRIWRQVWRGIVRAGEDNVASNGAKHHPCQKPIELMRWCVGFTESPLILDPYMGSGTTLRAAKDCNRKAIGIELEEHYCEIAARRLSQEVLNFHPPSGTDAAPVPPTTTNQ